MDTVSYGRIMQEMQRIHHRYTKTYSNYYNSYSKVGDDVLFEVIIRDSTIVFCIKEATIYRAFYYSGDEAELVECLSRLPAGTIFDIVDKNRNSNYRWIEKTGFSLYTTYIRFGHSLPSYTEYIASMTENKLDMFYDEKYGQTAKMEEIPEIQSLIYRHFDPKSDHLFTDSQMEELITEGSVYVQREEDSIVCILIARIIGKKIYMNLIVNEGTADISYSMEKKATINAIKTYGVNYEYAWIDERNKKALKRCKVKEDNLYNHIYEKR